MIDTTTQIAMYTTIPHSSGGVPPVVRSEALKRYRVGILLDSGHRGHYAPCGPWDPPVVVMVR